MTEPQEHTRRAWPVRLVSRFSDPFVGALVTGTADPPSPLPAWRRPAALQHLAAYLRIRHIDAVVVAEIMVALFIFSGTLTVLGDANQRAGTPVGDGEMLIFAAAGAAVPLLLRNRWPLAAWRTAVPSLLLTVLVTRQVYRDPGAADNPYPPGAVITYLLVLYAVGLRCRREISVGVWAMSVLGMWIVHPTPSVFLGAVMTAAALLFGYNWRTLIEQRTSDSPMWRPVLAGQPVRFGQRPADLRAPAHARPSVVYLQNASDPIVWWSPDLLFSRPGWLDGDDRGPDVSGAMRWYPIVTFWQVTVDLLASTQVPAGHGHSYGGSVADAWAAMVPPPGWTDADTARLRALLS